MPTVKVTKVNITGSKYVAKYKDAQDDITYEDVIITGIEDIPTPPTGKTWEGTSRVIVFDTPSGTLTNNQYATQANGYHWVKLPKCSLIKIDPGYVINNILSQAGVDWITAYAGET